MTYTDLIAAVAELVPAPEFFTVEVSYLRHTSGNVQLEWSLYTEPTGHIKGPSAESALEAFRVARANPVPDTSQVNADEVQP